MKKGFLIILLLTLSFAICSAATKKDNRSYWSERAYEMSRPLLENLSRGELRKNMPVESIAKGRESVAHLEAVGRLLCGIAPWLELPSDDTKESEMREELLSLAHKGLANAVDPQSPDYLNFTKDYQPLVDAAFLAQAFIRSPKRLWGELDSNVKNRIIEEMKSTRSIRPWFNNWLLFSAMIEAFLANVGEDADLMRCDYAFRQMEQWYVGDGMYKDGENYHSDYYNSFVIQPMLVDAGITLNKRYPGEGAYNKEQLAKIKSRAARYAEFLERSISPEGTFPVYGRSILYRTGCMHALSHASLLKILPEDISEAQVRAALTSVIRRSLSVEGTYDNGWLSMGFSGGSDQKQSGETYLCTGSMYLASTIFLPLGLPAGDSFWVSPEQDWTSKKAWSGKSFPRDSAIKD